MTPSPLPMDQTREPSEVKPIHGAIPIGEALARALKNNPNPDLRALGEAMEGEE